MKKFKIYPIINGVSDFRDYTAYIENIVIKNSLENGLPFGYIDFNDTDGDILSKFNNLQIGAAVDFKVVQDEQDEEFVQNLKIEDWVILRVIAKNREKNGNNLLVRLIFGNKMFLYKDMTNHCFAPQSNSEIIKQVLEDETRGCSFELVESDYPDNEPIKRFKVQESDWEFLKNKIVSVSSYKKTPMYLYSDLSSKFHFSSIATMSSKNPNALLYLTQNTEEEGKALEQFINNYNAKELDQPIEFTLDIGQKEALESMNRQFSIFDSKMCTVFSGVKGPMSKIENDSSQLAKYYPIDFSFAATTQNGSSIATINNHDLNDAYNLLNNSLKGFDGMFTLSIKTRFNSELLNVGSCIALFYSKNHWANGKWILTESELLVDKMGNSSIDLKIVRPTFSGKKSKTTLENYGSLFSR